ncbi:MAG: permease-like cell division protein FtsX [Desulfobacteraceae bacterium]|jgi:cell division transport system permease protein
MVRLLKRAIRDLVDNRFLSIATILTIALTTLAVGTFGLVFFNAETLLNSFKSGIRLMVYLKANANKDAQISTEYQLKSLAGIKTVRFISKNEGLQILKAQLKRQASLIEDLNKNPLPDAFEVNLVPENFQQDRIDAIAEQIETLPYVANVEYGQEWFQRYAGLFNLFKMGSYVLGGVLAIASVLIVANTIRIVLYTRKEEIDIMCLVGATDNYIKGPFYFQGIIQGAVGSLLGLTVLYIGYLSINSQIQLGFATGLLSLRFLPFRIICGISVTGMIVGWVGSFISLNQFLKA